MSSGTSRGWGWPWSVLTVVLGVGALVFGGSSLGQEMALAARTSDPIDAVVTQVDYASGTGMGKRYFPTVAYVVAGTTYEEATQNHRGSEPVLGSTVSITYDRSDPRIISLTAASGGGGTDWGGTMFLLVTGSGLIAAGVGFSPAVQSRRR